MIDIKNGRIKFNIDSDLIKNGITKSEFMKSVLFDEVLKTDDYAYTNY